MKDCFVANLAAVAHEAFEEETVLINFERGTYFSLRQSAPAIWAMIQDPMTLDDVLASLAGAHGPLPPEAAEAVAAMLDRLCEEGCALRTEAERRPLTAQGNGNGGGSFALPLVQAFHDLEELIAIDPVHETNEAIGWPVRAPDYKVEGAAGH